MADFGGSEGGLSPLFVCAEKEEKSMIIWVRVEMYNERTVEVIDDMNAG